MGGPLDLAKAGIGKLGSGASGVDARLADIIAQMNAGMPGGASVADRLGITPLQAAAISAGGAAAPVIGSTLLGLPGIAKLGLLGAGAAGARQVFGGGGSAQTYPATNTGTKIGIGGMIQRAQDAYQGLGQYASANGGGINDLLAQLMAAEAGGGAGSGRYDTAADTMNAESTRMNAETNRYQAEVQAKLVEAQMADMMYQRTVDEANLALKRGDLQLAREKFEDSKIWSARAADAADESNRLQGLGIQTNAFGKMGDLQLGALGAQTDAYSSAGNLTNSATGLELGGLSDAGKLEQQGFATQGDLYGNAGQLGVSNFSAVEDALLGRANVQARGAENYSSLTNIIGNLLNEQNNLALQIATTPRNAIAGFLMGRGQNGGAAAAFNPGNLMGINPGMLQGVIQSALQSAGQVGVMPAMQQFDVNGIIQGMLGAGNNAAAAGTSAANQLRAVASQAQSRVAPDVSALRQVGASAPGAIQGAVAGLSNAAAQTANRVPATIPAPPNSAAAYQASLDQMIANGAPQAAIDMYRNNMAAAGLGSSS